MGWGRTLLLGDIGNRLDIGDTECDIKAMRRRLKRKRSHDLAQDQRLDALEAENEELKLYLASLLRLLVARRVLAEEELAAFVALIDADTEADADARA